MALPISDLAGKIIAAVAVACTLGGGGVVLDAQRDNAVQDEQLEALKQRDTEILAALRDATRKMDENNEKLARFIGRDEGRRDGK